MTGFKAYAVRRLVHALGMGLALVLAFSLLFHQVAEQGLRVQLDEEVSALMRAAGPLDTDAYTTLREATVAAKVTQYHLDEPWWGRVLYGAWNVASFQFGSSMTLRTATGDREVLALIAEALPNTLLLFTSEAVLVFLLGGWLGLWVSQRPGRLADKALAVVPLLTGGLPVWWVGMLVLLGLNYALPATVSLGSGWLHLAVPLAVLVLLNLWGVAWQVRNLVAGALGSEAITAARARGIPERKILAGHVLGSIRPALVTLVVLGLLDSLSGNLLIEGIFQWPGLGNLYFVAVQQNDVPVLVGVLTLQTALNLVGLVLLDLTYGWMDPRIRRGGNP